MPKLRSEATLQQKYLRTHAAKRRLKLAIEAGAPAVKIARLKALYERNKSEYLEAKIASIQLLDD